MAEVPVTIKNFTGVNTTDSASIIQDGELAVCDNFDIGRTGELTRRPGWNKINTTEFPAEVAIPPAVADNSLKLIGFFNTSTYSVLIAYHSKSLYTSVDGATWTLLGTEGAFPGVESGLQYTDKFYIFRNADTILQYDGVTLTALAGTPTATYGLVHKDRLFLFNTKSTTLATRLRFSAIANFADWPSTNFIDINPGDGDWCVGLSILSDVLLIFKANTIWGLYATGDPTTWSLRAVNAEIGCVSHYSILQVDSFIYFVSPRGVYRTDGVSFQEISYPIRKELEDRIVTQATLNLDMAIRYEDRIIYMLHPSPTVHTHYTYYFQVKGWTRWPHAGAIKPGPYIRVQSDDPLPAGIYAGDHGTERHIYRLSEESRLDNGLEYTCTLETKDYDFDTPHDMKRGKWMGITVQNGGSVVVSYIVDHVVKAAATIVDDAFYRTYKVPGPGFFRTCRIKVTNTSGTALKVFGFSLILNTKSKIIKSGV